MITKTVKIIDDRYLEESGSILGGAKAVFETIQWEVLDAYFRDHSHPFTQHHLDSFQEFLKTYIPKIISSYNPITMVKLDDNDKQVLKVEVFIGGTGLKPQLYIDRPVITDGEGKQTLLTPHEARLRNLTYETHLFADITVRYEDMGKVTEHSFPRALIGGVPIMLHSEPCVLHGQSPEILRALKECPYDSGGYFIIDGKEKVIISQERITTNRLFVEKAKDPDYSVKGMIRSTGSKGETALAPRTLELYIVADKSPTIAANPDKSPEEKSADDEDTDDDDRPSTKPKKELKRWMRAILVSLPMIKGKLPLFHLFRLLGVESDKDIIEHILGDVTEERNKSRNEPLLQFLRASVAHAGSTGIFTTAAAAENIRLRTFYKSSDYVKNIIADDILPNMGTSLSNKARFLGMCVRNLVLTAMGIRPFSDRDSYMFKRVDLSGYMCATLFQEVYKGFRDSVRNLMDREYHYGPWKNSGNIEELVRKDNLWKIVSSNLISTRMRKSLKGMWGSADEDPEQGKVQDLSRISYVGFLSHLRRVNTPLDRSIKLTAPHRLHSQQWGVMCPFESPDGASIGYLKNFALLCHVTAGSDPVPVIQCLRDLGMQMLSEVSIPTTYDQIMNVVYVNGTMVGVHDEAHTLVDHMRLYRRNGLLHPFVSISWNIVDREVRILTESGRPCRPLFLLPQASSQKLATMKDPKTGHLSWFAMTCGTTLPIDQRQYDRPSYTPPHLVVPESSSPASIVSHLTKNQCIIEFVDIEEENTRLVAVDPSQVTALHTHLEIHPSSIFSVVTNNIPFAQHNQAPRNIFHGAQGKQAIGVYATNYTQRFDTNAYIQHYPQKPLITTRPSQYTGCDQLPWGANTIVAIATYSGYNQEDAVIINKSSLDRGLFTVTSYKTVTEIEQSPDPDERVIFANPIHLRTSGKTVEDVKHANYTMLSEDGFIAPETRIPRGAEVAVVGKVRVTRKNVEVKKGMFKEMVVKEEIKDCSHVTDVYHYGTVDKVVVTNQGFGTTNRICKVRMRKVRRPEPGDKMCLTPDHDVLTTEGWVPIADVTKKHHVCALLDDGSITYTQPSELYQYNCDNEDMYHIKSQQLDLMTTLNHKMYVKPRNATKHGLHEAKTIMGKRVSYQKNGVNAQPEYTFILPAIENHPARELPMDPFLVFLGFWISDGWASHTVRMRPGRKTASEDYLVEICQVNPIDKARLLEVIREMGFTPNTSTKDKVKIDSKQLATYFLPFSVGAPYKRLPEWVWKLSERQCQVLYEGLRRGDGSVTKSNSDVYFTSSKHLADDVQRFALHAGWAANIKARYPVGHTTVLKDGRTITSKHIAYAVNIVKAKCQPTVNHGHVRTQKIQKEGVVKYTGQVYCLEVPSHVFYVRRNGLPVWTGNSSRHGQKGVVGMVMKAEDMPYTKDGVVPDIIINPHAFPSRMTIGHLVECVFAKLCSIEGTRGDGTVFIPVDRDAISSKLEDHGFERQGNEVMYNGRTGDMIETDIFIGPTYYLRLKHMVADKMHSRSTGPKVMRTHQPSGGRSNMGGLRIGEMERDTMISHGAAQFLKESMMERSDKYKYAVCKHCGTAAVFAPDRMLAHCGTCQSFNISVIETPYAFKLLAQEMEAMGVAIRLSAEEFSELDDLDDLIEETVADMFGGDLNENELVGFNQEKEEEGDGVSLSAESSPSEDLSLNDGQEPEQQGQEEGEGPEQEPEQQEPEQEEEKGQEPEQDDEEQEDEEQEEEEGEEEQEQDEEEQEEKGSEEKGGPSIGESEIQNTKTVYYHVDRHDPADLLDPKDY